MSSTALLVVKDLAYSYGATRAVDGLSFEVGRGEVFGFLGPNGGGKTTLFRLLATLLVPQAGSVSVDGFDLMASPHEVRRRLGIVFQSPSVDVKLTVRENMRHQGHLYGLRGHTLEARIDEMLERTRLTDRSAEIVETLSGGLRRRVDLAKGLMHRPALVLLDEPTTGLDPGARLDLWAYLQDARRRDGLSVLLTTHLMEDAEQCDRLAIVNHGRIIDSGSPDSLRSSLGGEVVVARSRDPEALAARIRERFGEPAEVVEGTVRVQRARGAEFVPQLFDAFPHEIEAISVGKPTLEDVFIQRTGHRLWSAGE